MQPHSTYQKLVFSALCIALYIVVMTATQSFAFGQYQIRIATALYGLASLFPFLAVPLSLANVISNTLMGGLGLPDMIGGFLVWAFWRRAASSSVGGAASGAGSSGRR